MPSMPGMGGMPIMQQQSRPAAPAPVPAAPAKSDQPMVTIKRVMNPGISDPTVTISVKKEEEKEPEKVLFTLVNGQVMKTDQAPENLIPTAKPIPEDLARRILPDKQANAEAGLSKKQRKKLKKQAGESSSNIPGLVTGHSNNSTTSQQPTSAPSSSAQPGLSSAVQNPKPSQQQPVPGARVPRME